MRAKMRHEASGEHEAAWDVCVRCARLLCFCSVKFDSWQSACGVGPRIMRVVKEVLARHGRCY